jgi:stearoyl-CoA desaturase (delta-9 desaturase)
MSKANEPKSPRRLNFKNIHWSNSIFLVISPLIALTLTPVHIALHGLHLSMILLFIFYCFATSLSITAGYHRLFSHQSYRARPWVQVLFLLFGAAALQGSALKWCTDHRRHHRKVDTLEDPYSIQQGFWYAHMGWIFFKEESPLMEQAPQDLKTDPLILWQDRYYLLIAVIIGFVIPGILGYGLGAAWGGVVVLGFLRVVFTHHCTFLINSGAHSWGRQPYNIKNSARDNAFLAFFTYGEGYHNFHHQFETDYRNGIRWYQWDPTKWLIASLSWMGGVDRLRKVPDYTILKAQIKLKQFLIEQQLQRVDMNQVGHSTNGYLDRYLQLCQRIDKAHQQLVQTREAYQKAMSTRKQQLKVELKLAKI